MFFFKLEHIEFFRACILHVNTCVAEMWNGLCVLSSTINKVSFLSQILSTDLDMYIVHTVYRAVGRSEIPGVPVVIRWA